MVLSVVLIISPWKRDNNYPNACVMQSREHQSTRHVSQRESAGSSGLAPYYVIDNRRFMQTVDRTMTLHAAHDYDEVIPDRIVAASSRSVNKKGTSVWIICLQFE